MVKDIIESNNSIQPGSKELDVLRENFPACFHTDGTFDLARFKEYLTDKVDVTSEGYELRFLGKNYARLLASIDTTTVVVPDEEHNAQPENKDSKNIYISGDNIDALKHLLKSYAGKIKCIYIDPPYNTGSDGFVYNDSFNFTAEELSTRLSIDEEEAARILDLTRRGSASHSAWLMFMLPRLVLARDLLTADGVIFISIDDNEQSNLKLLCDDVFGEENHLATIARRTKTGGGSAADSFAVEHDYICVYARNASIGGTLFMPFSAEYLKRYNEEDEQGKYFWDTMERSSTKTRPYTITAPDGSILTGKWFRSESRFKMDLEKGEVRFLKKSDNTWSVQFKQRLAEGKKMRSLLCENEFKSYSDDLDNLGLAGTFSYPKTVYLIEYLLQLVDDGSTVLDFFSGSATTAEAVMQENCKRMLNRNDGINFIMVQLSVNLDDIVTTSTGDALDTAKKAINVLNEIHQPHTLDQIGIERIKRAADKIKRESPLFHGDLGFKHYTLKEPSAKALEQMEAFDPHVVLATNTLAEEFGNATILTTWMVRDGYTLTPEMLVVDLCGYEAYHCDKHLYLIHTGLSTDAIDALVTKYEKEVAFNPINVVVYGYAFTWSELQALKDNLRRLSVTDKNIRVNIDIRY